MALIVRIQHTIVIHTSCSHFGGRVTSSVPPYEGGLLGGGRVGTGSGSSSGTSSASPPAPDQSGTRVHSIPCSFNVHTLEVLA